MSIFPRLIFPRLIVVLVALAPKVVFAAMSVAIATPSPGAIASTSLGIGVTVTSDYQVKTVHAQVQAVGVDLSPGWGGSLSLASVPMGTQTLTITATDTFSNSASATVSFIHDLPPTLAVTAPLEGTVARPSVALDLSCSDPDGGSCQSLTVKVAPTSSCTNGQTVATGTASIHQTVSLAAFEGKAVEACVTATDNNGQITQSTVNLYVESSPRLVENATVGGPIVDVDDSRILYTAGGSLFVHDRANGTDSLVAANVTTGAFVAGGVVFRTADEHVHAVTTQDLDLGPGQAYGLSARGTFIGWVGVTNHDCWMRDLAANASVNVSATVAPESMDCKWIAVDGAGKALFHGAQTPADHPVRLYAAGASSTLVHCGTFGCKGPVTDGVSFAFYQGSVGQLGLKATWFVPPQGPAVMMTTSNEPPESYALNGGWLVYTDASNATGVAQAWLRAADGSKTQVSVFNDSSFAETTNASGAVLYFHSGSRLLATSSGVIPETISSTLGRGLALGAKWYVVLGRTLFEIGLVGGADAGSDAALDGAAGSDAALDGAADATASDGSTPDAGEEVREAGASPTNADVGGGAKEDCACNAVGGGASSSTAPSLIALAFLSLRGRRRRVS